MDLRVVWLRGRDRVERVLLVQIASVLPNSAAYRAGVRENMVIHAIGGSTVEDLTRAEFAKVLDRPPDRKGNLVLTVLQGLDKRKIAIPTGVER